jgi:predicted dithiol-disulfide oxidoreductase (DUF899 family)
VKDESANPAGRRSAPPAHRACPRPVDRGTFQAEPDSLRVREKAHTREGDAIAAVRRHLPMTGVDVGLVLTGLHGPLTLLEAFEGRRQRLLAGRVLEASPS